jgi:CheY-like chemotaxis protein
VQGDETRLLQVVLNLLGNALRHAPGAPITLRLSVTASHAVVTVADLGPGMTAQMLEQIFTPFYQGPQSIARSTGGLGLGLAIAHNIVSLHGGTLTAHSEGPGKGCQFHIELPLGVETRPAPRAQLVAQPRIPARVLVIDDNTDAASTMAESLTVAGYDVRVGHSAAAALGLSAEFTPQVAILDIGLPDTDGFTLARRLRAGEHGQHLGLIALTGYGQREDQHRALEAGFDVHLTKPVSLDILLHHIDTLLQTRKALGADRFTSMLQVS